METLSSTLGTMQYIQTVLYSYLPAPHPNAQDQTFRNGLSGNTRYITESSSRKYVRPYATCVPSDMYSKFSGKLALVRSDYLWFTHITQNFAVLKVLHQAGWVHRDISSANILTDSTGRVKLIDLEYAKKADDESRRDMRVVCSPVSYLTDTL